MRLFIFLFRASRSLNNKVSTAQHEAILAQVFCDEVELFVDFQYVPSSFFSDGCTLCIAEQYFAKMTLNHFSTNIDPSGLNSPGARFSNVPVTFRARNQIFKSKYKE